MEHAVAYPHATAPCQERDQMLKIQISESGLESDYSLLAISLTSSSSLALISSLTSGNL